MQLQPVVMNLFTQNPAPDSSTMPSSANASGKLAESPFIQLLQGAEAVGKAQDRRIADDLRTRAKGRTPTAKMLGLLQLQYDLDDMQFSAQLATSIASKVSKAVNTLTQRA
jgi:hypothetical protein